MITIVPDSASQLKLVDASGAEATIDTYGIVVLPAGGSNRPLYAVKRDGTHSGALLPFSQVTPNAVTHEIRLG